MTDASRSGLNGVPGVMHWVHEPARGQIQGCDRNGQVVVAIATGPLFGERLAAAFTPSSFAATAPAANPMPDYGNAASIQALVTSSQAAG